MRAGMIAESSPRPRGAVGERERRACHVPVAAQRSADAQPGGEPLRAPMRIFGVMTGLLRRRGSHTPDGAFSSKWGNKNYYKGKGAKKFGKVSQYGARARHRTSGGPTRRRV